MPLCAVPDDLHWSTSYCKVSDKTDNLLYSSRCLTFISSMAFVAKTVAAIDNRKLKKMKAAAEQSQWKGVLAKHVHDCLSYKSMS